MITEELFKSSEVLRTRLASSIDILELAFQAAIDTENQVHPSQHDALAYSMAYEGKQAVLRFQETIRRMARVPRETVGPIEANYNGTDPYEQIKLDADREYAESLSKKSTNRKTK